MSASLRENHIHETTSQCVKPKAEIDLADQPLNNLTSSNLQYLKRKIYTARRKWLPHLSQSEVHDALNELQAKPNGN